LIAKVIAAPDPKGEEFVSAAASYGTAASV
jgi:hypothetical protein